jgi:hypothetical protein
LSAHHSWIAALWELPQAPRRVYADGEARVPRALSAGLLLTYLLSAAEHHPRHCKVERAKALVAEFPLPGGEKASESLIEKAWAEFKIVAHFWAAHIAVAHDMRANQLHDRQWCKTLGLADAFRVKAEKARILVPDEAWRVEDPRVRPRRPKIEALTPDRLAFLDTSFPL